MLIVPERPTNDWFQLIVAPDSPFRLVAYSPAGTLLFTGSKKNDPLSADRLRIPKTTEPITVWELSKEFPNNEVIPYEEVPEYKCDVLDYLTLKQLELRQLTT